MDSRRLAVRFILVDWAKVKAANPQGFVNWLGTVFSSGLTGEALQRGTIWTFIVAGIASLVLAAFSLSLPHTPPRRVEQGAEKLAWLEAGKLLAIPFILVLWLVKTFELKKQIEMMSPSAATLPPAEVL